MCWKSQDISSGMRKIGKGSDHFGIEIALTHGTLGSVTRESWVRSRKIISSRWQPLLFHELSFSFEMGRKKSGLGDEFDYAGD